MTDFVFQEQWASETKAGEGYFYVEGIGLKARFENGKVTYLINTPEGYKEFPYTISIPEHYAVWRDGDTVVEERYDGKYEFRYSLPEPTKVKMHLIVNSRPTQIKYQFPLQLPEGFYLRADDEGLKICKVYEWLGGEIVFATFPHQFGTSSLGKTIHVNYTVEDNIPYLNYIPEELDALTPEDYPLDLDPSLILTLPNPSFWFGWMRNVYVFPSGKTFVLLVDDNNILRTYWCYHNQNWQTGPTITNVARSWGVYGFGAKDDTEDVLLFYRKTNAIPYAITCLWSGSSYSLGTEAQISSGTTQGHPGDAIYDSSTGYWYLVWQLAPSPYTCYAVKTPHGSSLSFSPLGTSPYGSDANGTNTGIMGTARICLVNNKLYGIVSHPSTAMISFNRMVDNTWGSAVTTNIYTKSGNITGSFFAVNNKIQHVFWKLQAVLGFYEIDTDTNTYTQKWADVVVPQTPSWDQGPACCYIGDCFFVPIEISSSNLHLLYKITNGNISQYASITRPTINTGGGIGNVDNVYLFPPANFAWHGFTTSSGYYLYEYNYTYSPPQPTKRRRRVGFWWRNRKLVKRLLQD